MRPATLFSIHEQRTYARPDDNAPKTKYLSPASAPYALSLFNAVKTNKDKVCNSMAK